jgi:hypothetical protein
LLSEAEQKRREGLGIPDAEYVPPPRQERAETDMVVDPPAVAADGAESGLSPEVGPEAASGAGPARGGIPPSLMEAVKAKERAATGSGTKGGAQPDPGISSEEQAAIIAAAQLQASSGNAQFGTWVSELLSLRQFIHDQHQLQAHLVALERAGQLSDEQRAQGNHSIAAEREALSSALTLLVTTREALREIGSGAPMAAGGSGSATSPLPVDDDEDEGMQGEELDRALDEFLTDDDPEEEEEEEEDAGNMEEEEDAGNAAPGGAKTSDNAGPEAAGGAL